VGGWLSGGGSPRKYFLLSVRVCADSEALGCDLVLCLCVTGLGVLYALCM